MSFRLIRRNQDDSSRDGDSSVLASMSSSINARASASSSLKRGTSATTKDASNRSRSRSKIEDSIIAMKENLFAKLEKYEMEGSNTLAEVLRDVIHAPKQIARRRINSSFDSVTTAVASARQPSPQQASSNISRTVQISEQNIKKVQTCEDIPHSKLIRVMLPELKKRDSSGKREEPNIKSSDQPPQLSRIRSKSTTQEPSQIKQTTKQCTSTIAPLHQQNKGDFLPLELKKVVFKDPKIPQSNGTVSRKNISEIKARSRQYQVRANITSLLPLSSSSSSGRMNPLVTEVHNFIISGRVDPIDQEEMSEAALNEEIEIMRFKQLDDYNDGYTGLEEYEDSDGNEEQGEYDDDIYGIKILDDFEKLFASAVACKQGIETNGISDMRKDCSDIDKDLKSIKEIFVSMRSNWEEFEEAGADCEDIDSFVREMEKKK